MGVLNNARTMYVGSTPVDAVYIGGKRVWVDDDSDVVEVLVDEPTPFGVAFDFPTSPAENAEYTATNGIVYVYKAPRWVVKAVPTGAVDWDDILDKPATFPPSTHTHLWADITDKPTTFAPSTHGHAISDVSGLQATLDSKQPIDGDLTAIAAITPANDDIIQRKSGAWINRTMAQLKTDLALNNVDNTSDANKPVSTAQAAAIALKQDTDADLTALAALTGTNTIYYRSAANTWTAVTMGGNMTFTGGTLNSTGGGQPLDADLTAIAALATTGIVRRTATDTWTASNAVTNAELATMAAFTFKGNNTSGAAVPTDVTIAGLTTKATPTAADWVLISDTAASAAFKKAAWPSGGSVTPAALTKTDDTNVTLTLGGTPTTALLQATSITVGWSGSLAATRGGTGQTSYAVGDLLYGTASNTLSKLAGVATGNALISGGVTTAPSWGKIALTTHVSGTLPIGNGGTGQTTAANALNALDGVPKTGNTTIAGGLTATSYTISGTNYWSNTGIVASAGFKPGGGAWSDSSDIRIKNIEGEYTRGLADVVALRPVYFTYKGNDTPTEPEVGKSVPYPNSSHSDAATLGKKFAGFIAQEVEVVMPEMVSRYEGYIDGVAVDDIRVLDTSALIFALVNSVKELTARIEQLESVVP